MHCEKYMYISFQVSGNSFEMKMFPRASAHAERLWTNPKTSYVDAQKRLVDFNHMLQQRGVGSDAVQVSSFYRVTKSKWDKFQNCLPIKDPQCFSKHHETWLILSYHEMVILTKFVVFGEKLRIFYK